jgi:hypothetical protein
MTDIQPQPLEPIPTITAEAPAVSPTAVAAAKPAVAVTAPDAVLHGDELIELSIKPSHWYILFASSRVCVVMLACAIAVAVMGQRGWNFGHWFAIEAAFAIAALRVALAATQWASRLYVLTNRRVLVFQGMWQVEVRECPLARISACELHVRRYEQPFFLGSLSMTPCSDLLPALVWWHIKRPQEIHERLLRAIRRAQSGGGA